MRLVIRDYLLQLKEKDELDLLLCDLLLQMGYVVDNTPKSGNRQFGVDIQAHNRNELLLFVVKQKTIDRRTWDSDPNSVRQSINEILDTYLIRLPESMLRREIHIVVATNGNIDETVRPSWDGFVKQNTNWNNIPLRIDFWGIDEITCYVEKHLFDEHLFPAEQQSRLRKALYFIGENDYKHGFYEQIIDSYLSYAKEALQKTGEKKKREFSKCMAGMFLSIQMISAYAQNEKRYRIAIEANEYLIIRYWKLMLEEELFAKEKYCDWLLKFCKKYEEANNLYYSSIRNICENRELFPKYYSGLERRFMLYEVLGYLATYAVYCIPHLPTQAQDITNTIIKLINDHEELPYVPLDSMIGTVSILFSLFSLLGKEKDLRELYKYYVATLMAWYRNSQKHPSAADTFRDALDIEMGNQHESYESSGLWGYFLLWLYALDMSELYDEVKCFIEEDLKDTTKCVWYLRPEEEYLFYDAHAMNLSGEGLAIDAQKKYESFKAIMNYIAQRYAKDVFSFDTFSFPALEMIVCRYYGYVPRVPVNIELQNKKKEKPEV